MMQLNLGCGNKPLEGFVNHDFDLHSPHVDISWDLNVLPWPWENCSFDKVAALSVLEHLNQNILASMNELWRIIKPGGVAVVKLPAWNHPLTWDDPTHLHPVGPGVMDQLDPRTKRGVSYRFYTPYKWRIDKFQANKAKSSYHWTMTKMSVNWDGDRG